MAVLRVLDAATIAAAAETARSSPRGRANHNLHPKLDDPVQRFLNVFQPSSYVRPHRHAERCWELFLLLEGEALSLLFDDAGGVLEHAVLRRGGARAIEIPGGRWHTLLVNEPDTLLFEIKPGPYAPITDKDSAAWAPAADGPEAQALLAEWRRRFTPPA